ncbi:hypothetical protein PHMEG_0006624 [Phytophthora megakarya]|uniref:Uncharacterized protein n=1 Tax=Phytophthora megakarya TaxID=4795 RepID=A0A225WNF4_9STRA|nr:hypothetical protein PHMEG_0006624 [Phytophthora megakarya]
MTIGNVAGAFRQSPIDAVEVYMFGFRLAWTYHVDSADVAHSSTIHLQERQLFVCTNFRTQVSFTASTRHYEELPALTLVWDTGRCIVSIPPENLEKTICRLPLIIHTAEILGLSLSKLLVVSVM